MKKFELVFIPLPVSSHLTSAIEFAKRLVDHDETLSITFLMILLPNQTDLDPKTKSVAASYTRIRFIIIPPTASNFLTGQISLEMFAKIFIESHKPQVEKAAIELASDGATQLVGFVLDMFCTNMIEDKKECHSTGWIEIKNWLDSQPLKSVIFLCFGTNGCFSDPQREQMAIALERSGHRFLWSIRKPPPKDTLGAPTEYTNLEDALPDGFIERVKERGMVCGWAPQVEVLAHGAIKGFVSHCGWNSILESLVYGVPIATWPLAAEQQLNAFGLVRELGLAVELSLSYRSNGTELVMADQIEKAICSLMDDENPVRERVKKISEKSRKVLENGGSSFVTLGKFVEDLLQNIC